MTDFPVTGASQAFVDALNANFAALTPSALTVYASKTASYSVLASDTFTEFDNIGASGAVTFTLPVPAVGLVFGFAVMAAYNLIVRAPGGSYLYLGTVPSSSGGTLTSSSVGSYVQIKCRSATVWIIQATTGTWAAA